MKIFSELWYSLDKINNSLYNIFFINNYFFWKKYTEIFANNNIK